MKHAVHVYIKPTHTGYNCSYMLCNQDSVRKRGSCITQLSVSSCRFVLCTICLGESDTQIQITLSMINVAKIHIIIPHCYFYMHPFNATHLLLTYSNTYFFSGFY